IANHIEPLAIASNILQSPTCRLDTVLLVLGNLFRIFQNLPASDLLVTQTVHASLERKWAKTDQELMILGVFFNPYIRSRCFNPDSLPCMTMFHLIHRAYERLFRQSVDNDVEFYLLFSHILMTKTSSLIVCELSSSLIPSMTFQKKPIDLVPLWKRLDGASTARSGRGGFVKLAIRILSMLPNSAGPERTFSFFGLTHRKHRNRLDPGKVHNTAIVRNDCQKRH
ncbi:hypothetical protein C8J57DRAFT_961696, partial [Mycena rebaudengoi]